MRDEVPGVEARLEVRRRGMDEVSFAGGLLLLFWGWGWSGGAALLGSGRPGVGEDGWPPIRPRSWTRSFGPIDCSGAASANVR